MLPMILSWLGSLLGGPFAASALAAYKAKLENENSADARAADLAAKEAALDVQRQQLEQAVVLAEEGHWYTAIVRPLFAAPFVIFLWKVLVLDRFFGWHTDDLLAWEVDLCKWIISAYFGHGAVTAAARALSRKGS